MEKVNWGIIGLGRIAEVFSNAFEEAENAKLLAVASKDQKKLNHFKDLFDLGLELGDMPNSDPAWSSEFLKTAHSTLSLGKLLAYFPLGLKLHN